jgi:predicted dehydrogenase
MTTNRRAFIRDAALTTTGVSLFPTIMNGCKSPNDTITVALVGCKGMGFNDLSAFLDQPNVVCAAMCDVDSNILQERAAEVEKRTGKKPDLYEDFRKVMDRKDIDVVIVGTPDHWHCLPTIYACQTGKDVYCEKPLGNSIEECNLMVKAARKYNRVVQVGQWQRSDPHWKNAVDYVQSGQLGRVRSVRAWSYVGWKGSVPIVPDSNPPAGVNYDMWLGPAPLRPFNKNRFHFTFRWFWDYAGGLMTDWGVHLLDYALYGMNEYVPKSVMASGGKYAFPDDAMETPDTLIAVYDFGKFNIVWDHTIGIYGQNYGKGSGHGVAFVGEYGTLEVDRNGWQVIPETRSLLAKEGMQAVPLQPSTGKGLDLHVKNFLECIKTRQKPNCDIEIGAHIARIAQLGNIAYRLGEQVNWDGDKQQFINNPKADEYIKAHYRAPWELPKI